MPSNPRLLLAALLLIGCGGGDPATDPATADAPAEDAASAATPQAAPDAAPGVAAEPFDTAAARGERPLLRETYGWRGSGRDPFRPLVVEQAGGPELVDLTLSSVIYQPTDRARSVAIFRDNGNNRRYTVGEGDRIGRLRVVSIEPGSATLSMNDFGATREQTYTLRRSEAGNP